jgi:hypothetical protein
LKPTDDEKSVMTAVTFAEAGEWETARWYAAPPGKARPWAWIERHLVAAAFAEEGLHEEALRASGVERASWSKDPLDLLLAARGIRMFSGVLSPAALSARR